MTRLLLLPLLLIPAPLFAQAGVITGPIGPAKPNPNGLKIDPNRRFPDVVLGETVQQTIVVSGPGRVRWGAKLCTAKPGFVEAKCDWTVPKNGTVKLIAEPKPGGVFSLWQTKCDETDGPVCTIHPDGFANRYATFVTGFDVALTITPGNAIVDATEPAAAGRIQCSRSEASQAGRCHMAVPTGAKATLQAKVGKPYRFIDWQGQPGCGQSPQCSFAVTKTTALTARIDRATWPLTVKTEGAAGFYDTLGIPAAYGLSCQKTQGIPFESMFCTGDLPVGATLTIHPMLIYTDGQKKPVPPSAFGGDCTGASGSTCTITMTAPKSISVTAFPK